MRTETRPVHTIQGVTSFRDKAAHTTMASVETVTVSTDQVTHRIGPLGDDLAGEVVESRDPAVIRYLKQVIDARKAHEYQLVSATETP